VALKAPLNSALTLTRTQKEWQVSEKREESTESAGRESELINGIWLLKMAVTDQH
jgi:hypothetical protein